MTKTDCRKIVQEKLKGLTKESGKNFSLSAENFDNDKFYVVRR